MENSYDSFMKAPPYCSFSAVDAAKIAISDIYWKNRLEVNLESALLHQYRQLERVGTIDNFRIVSGIQKGFRRGYYYCDSDAHKWADAASLTLLSGKNTEIEEILSSYIKIIEKAQQNNGYLFTYNQFHFPGIQWKNLLFEHELYTLGHLIEAGISHYSTTKSHDLLSIVIKTADLLLREFPTISAIHTPGHQELELAMIKLYRLTNDRRYFNYARELLEKRGKIFGFPIRMGLQRKNVKTRKKIIDKQKLRYEKTLKSDSDENLEIKPISGVWIHKLTPMNYLRAVFQHINGKYYQQHRTLRKMTVPVGHAVRWGYMMTAVTMLYQETGDQKLLSTLEKSWTRMVEKRMYITGGLGALHTIEGFGRDYELPNDQAYNETCSGIASLLWAWEMAITTGNSKYSDLLEWQLYNAISVGMGLDGKSYFYFNPLESNGNVKRNPWYSCACCPPNLSRTFAKIQHFIYGKSPNTLWIHQFIGNTADIELMQENPEKSLHIKVDMKSNLPWEGNCQIVLTPEKSANFTLKIRIPGWVSKYNIMVNDEKIFDVSSNYFSSDTLPPSRMMVFKSKYVEINRTWLPGDIVKIDFHMDILMHHGHKKVKDDRGKIALTRGPLVYCLESVDNAQINIPNATLTIDHPITDKKEETSLGEIVTLKGRTPDCKTLKFIPYFLWANRGLSRMQVWMKK